VVYHKLHNRIKRKLEEEGVEVIEGLPVAKDLADLLEKGK
jgi:predicted nuclease with RNAse H fold